MVFFSHPFVFPETLNFLTLISPLSNSPATSDFLFSEITSPLSNIAQQPEIFPFSANSSDYSMPSHRKQRLKRNPIFSIHYRTQWLCFISRSWSGRLMVSSVRIGLRFLSTEIGWHVACTILKCKWVIFSISKPHSKPYSNDGSYPNPKPSPKPSHKLNLTSI